jgi:hypothetical protein
MRSLGRSYFTSVHSEHICSSPCSPAFSIIHLPTITAQPLSPTYPINQKLPNQARSAPTC